MREENFRTMVRRIALWPIGVMLLLGVVLVGLIQFLLNSAQWVEHTDRVIAQAYVVEGDLVDMETGLRGYQVTGDAVFLEPYERANGGIEVELQRLGDLVMDNATQSNAVRELRARVDEWRAFAGETLARRRNGTGFEESSFNARGKQLMDSVRARVTDIAGAEQRLRLSRERSLDRIRAGLLGSVFLAVFVLGPGGALLLRRILRRTTQTYRESTERAQRQAEELRVTLRSIGDAVIATDAEGRVAFLNPVAEQLTGWPTLEAAGKMLEDVFPIFNEQTRAPTKNPVARALRELRVVGLANHTVLRARDGREIPIEDSAAPILGDAGEVHGVILVFHDVTAAREIERRMRESAERFHFLAESMPQKIFTAKPSGEVDYYNREWMEFTGLAFEQIRDWGWLQFIHPEDVDENVRRWQHSIDTQEPFYLEHRFLRFDGQYRWHVSRAVPMRDAAGNVLIWIGSNTDIEEVRQAKERAERASRAKDEFLAALSHELRTPLTPVLMTASILREDERLPQDVRDQLAMMTRNIELEARLIDDLLDLTRIAHGKLELRPQPCDAHSLVALAVEMVRSEARRKRQTLDLDLAAERSQLNCDPARMQQVFWNLLKNAVKFTPESGRLSVRSRDTEDRLTLEISDTGIGISTEALDRIFLPFEQAAANPADRRFGGLGLGLSISKAILDLHGGRIEAESAGPGRGATFRVELPATENPLGATPGSDSPSEGEAVRQARGRGARLPSLRLLLVEDHEPTLSVLERLLTRAGHHVTSAVSVAGALKAASAAGNLNAVISDVGLPDGTGFELMEKLREHYGLRGIALSGYGMDEDLRRSREAGFSAHLTKPISFAQLDQALAELMAETPQT